MKTQAVIVFLVVTVILTGCSSKKRSEEIKNYAFQENAVPLGVNLNNKLGDWVEKGTICYGLIVNVNAEGKILKGLPVKAKVVTISPDSLKMKALENVSLTEVKGCKKMGISKGRTWWEKEGDLFKTKEEAETYLRENGWLN